MVGDEVIEVLPAHGETLQDEHAWDPTPVADVYSPEFERLAELISATFPGALVAPYLMTGATDSRHYAPICQNVFRFSPFFLTAEEAALMHTANERLSFINAGRMVAFYQELIRLESSLAAESETEEEIELLKFEEEPKPRRISQHKRLKQTELEEEISVEEEIEIQPLPEDDEPLEVKPLKKSKGE